MDLLLPHQPGWAHLPSDIALGLFVPALEDEPNRALEVGGAGIAAAVLDPSGTVVRVNSSWRHIAETCGNTDPSHSLGRNYLRVCDAATGPHTGSARQAKRGLERLLQGEADNFLLSFDCGPTQDPWPSLLIASRAVDAPAVGVVVFQVPIQHQDGAAAEGFFGERASFLSAVRRMLAATHGGYRQPVVVVAEVDLLRHLDLARLPGAALGPLVQARIMATMPEAWAIERIGPTRFALCANVLGGAIGAGTLMHRLRAALTPPVFVADEGFSLWARFGGSMHPDHGLRPVDLLAMAERTLDTATVDHGPWFPMIAPPIDARRRHTRT